MTARRLFAAELPAEGGLLRLDDEARKHVSVLRLRPGAEVELFDGAGRLAQGKLVADGKVEAASSRSLPRPSPELGLILCLPKGKRREQALRAATEVGVAWVEPVHSERTQRVGELARPRLERVMREAARQSEQLYTPTLRPLRDLLEAAADVPGHVARLGCFTRVGERGSIPPSGAAAVVVGPEGGLTSGEIDALRALGYLSHPLGGGVLRVETAVPVALSLARARLSGDS